MGIFSAFFGSKKPASTREAVTCDVCNAATTLEQGTRIKAEDFRGLLANGFGIDQTNIKMLTDSGMSRDQAIAMLGAQYATSQSDWLLCRTCATRAKAIPCHDDSALEPLIEKERAEREEQVCTDSPERCDLCHQSLAGHRFMIDGEISRSRQMPIPGAQTMGEWGYMCAKCFAARGVGIKWGTGQLYQRNSAGEWVLVAGFQPEE